MLTGYDEHLVTYLRLLDAETDGADWTEVARIVLDIDPARETQRARRAWESHFAPREVDGRTWLPTFLSGAAHR